MKKYGIKRLKDFPDHVKDSCYVITEYGHTMFPEDVIKKLNDLERLLSEKHSSNCRES